jgi:hypothetical protein
MHAKEIIPVDDINQEVIKEKSSAIAGFFKKPTTIIIVLLIIGWVITYFYMDYKNSGNISKLEKAANEIIFNNENDWINQTVKPLSWAIRSEMLRENRENIEQYQNEFVKMPGFSNLMFINNEGSIWLSTDKKYEGSPFANHYNVEFISHNDVFLEADQSENIIKISAPIMGIDRRLGTLFVIYSVVEDKYLDAKLVLK